MEIVAQRGGNGEIVLALDGELDLGTAEPLRESLFDAIEHDGHGVAVDMRGCSFIDFLSSCCVMCVFHALSVCLSVCLHL